MEPKIRIYLEHIITDEFDVLDLDGSFVERRLAFVSSFFHSLTFLFQLFLLGRSQGVGGFGFRQTIS